MLAIDRVTKLRVQSIYMQTCFLQAVRWFPFSSADLGSAGCSTGLSLKQGRSWVPKQSYPSRDHSSPPTYER